MFQKIFSLFLIFILTFSTSFADVENILNFEENFLENFEIKNRFQNPTYLQEKEEEKEEYFCEKTEDCKVNFDFRPSFDENFKIKDFSCFLEFGEEKVETCNPNTILVESETEFKIKIFLKKDDSIFKERIIKILQKSDENILDLEEEEKDFLPENEDDKEKEGEIEKADEDDKNFDESENNENLKETEEIEEKEDSEENFLENFEIRNRFQNPTYLENREEEKDEYFCERNEDCKVNFDFRPSFDENFKIKDFSCFLEFGEEKLETCNPNTILVESETEFKIKIFLKKDDSIFKERIIKILQKSDENILDLEEEEKDLFPENEDENETEKEVENEKIDEDDKNFDERENNENLKETEEIEEKSEVEENFLENFEIINRFQNPTYLQEKEEEKEEYFCERNEDCKVNFDFRASFDENFKIKDFSCFLEFGEEKLETCNPNTILVEVETEFKIKVFSKKDENIFKERIIKILQKSEEDILEEENKEEIIFEKNEKIYSENQKTPDFWENFEIKNKFQNPTNLFEKEDDNAKEYFCTRKNCSVNFDFRPSFYGDFNIKNFNCIIEFEEQKLKTCNPPTLNFLEGDFEVLVKIINKKDENIFKTKKYKIKNDKKFYQSLKGKFVVEEAIIGVEYGLIDNKCEKGDCKVNFIFETKNRKLACKWDFGNGEYKTGTENRCNPGVVKFPKGKNYVSLKVYEKGNEGNFSRAFLEFENDGGVFEEEFEAKIFLEGNSKNFQKFDNLALCEGVSVCKINFSAKNYKNKKYFWDFGNGDTFSGRNPQIMEFSHGKYKISLKVFDDFSEKEDIFYLIVNKNKKENILNDDLEKIKSLKYRKNQEKMVIFGENENSIFVNKSFDFPVIGKFIYNKNFLIIPDENQTFKEYFNYDRAGVFNFDFYEIGENNQKILRETKKIEVSYQNVFASEILEMEKNEKKSRKNENLKKEEEKFLKIILQGKETKNKYLKGKTVICNGICSVNFGLETNIKGGKFIVWDLGNGDIFNGKNPTSRKYDVGNYKIFVKYEDEKGEFLSDEFEIKVNKKIVKTKNKKTKKGPVNLIIELQGKLGKNKILTNSGVICIKTCSVNFDGRKSSGAYRELIWDFGNGEKFIGENPKSIKYKDFGKYNVSLKTYDLKGNLYEKIFEIDFLESLEKEEKKDENENIFFEKELNEKLEKQDFIFIFIISFLILIFSVILFKRYKIF